MQKRGKKGYSSVFCTSGRRLDKNTRITTFDTLNNLLFKLVLCERDRREKESMYRKGQVGSATNESKEKRKRHD